MGVNGSVAVKGVAQNGTNPFTAGTQVGFVINQRSIAEIGAGTTAVITLTDVNGETESHTLSTDVTLCQQTY